MINLNVDVHTLNNILSEAGMAQINAEDEKHLYTEIARIREKYTKEAIDELLVSLFTNRAERIRGKRRKAK